MLISRQADHLDDFKYSPFLIFLSWSSVQPLDSRYPPFFDVKLMPMDMTLGDSVELNCHITGSLPIKVTWSKDHRELRAGRNYRISCVGNTPHLVILKASQSDSGVYSCHASNDTGKDACSAEVFVKGILTLSLSVVVC